MKPINKKCNYCEVDLVLGINYKQHRLNKKDYVCKDCYYEHNVSKRMFVNGKYVSKSHPFYKPGSYKTFEGAAFASLEGYNNTAEGEVYIITNKAWKGWIKVGMAIDAKDRCKSYQTSSPLRDYELKYSQSFKDRRTAETTAHVLCDTVSKERQGEWFKMPVKKAVKLIENITNE